ncbi:nucleotidyltransferase domain-containing protein [Fulvivirga ligni]|uniref:nucleotidyltransferase domain-containing protein n=1 Tax=Fulvivirga ligni TaxID=2904246 RepID=UPI001F30D114|nr:nucleotidyltransferase domain-containing protein [Fulvivirga ligni]UII19271.1 nucleotidyltransferase domain-containing protein [Fulvivirga ligni]
MMQTIIKSRLQQIEEEKSVRILYACETGSRAWGFPSPDSDYDVRCIYAEKLDWHLSLRARKDTFTRPINDDLDITGWEINKVLHLLWKSNAPLLERLQSPIIYELKSKEILDGLWELAGDCFSPIATMHHYHRMAKKYYDICYTSGNEVKLKSYFYAIRAVLCASWVREKMAIPQIEMNLMFELLQPETRDKVEELILLKSTKNEDYRHEREPVLDEYLKAQIGLNEAIANHLPGAKKRDIDQLDDFYRRVITEKL